MNIKKSASLDIRWILFLAIAMSLAGAGGFFVGYWLGT